MKSILLIATVLFTTSAYGQEELQLEGKYSAFFLGSETIEFKGTDSFYFYGNYCTNNIKGKGICEIKNNCLYLYFEKSTINDNDSLNRILISSSETSQSICDFKLSTVDSFGKPIQDMIVEIKKSSGKTVGNITDALGIAYFKLMKEDFPVVIKTYKVGVSSDSIKLEKFNDYSIKVFSKIKGTYTEVLNHGEEYIYELGAVSEEVIELRPKGDSVAFRKYKKVE